MTYETLDWETEAIRIGAAFHVEDSCRFEGEKAGVRAYIPQYDLTPHIFYLDDDLRMRVVLRVEYSARGRRFELTNENHEVIAAIYLNWDGTLNDASAFDRSKWQALVRALVCLDLFSPEVEAVLGVSVAAPRKSRWLAQFETDVQGRICFETLDWEAEEKRIAAAFGQVDGVRFSKDVAGRILDFYLPDVALSVEIEYDHEARIFRWDGNTLEEQGSAYIEWNGTVSENSRSVYFWVTTLGKGLFLLGFITDENQAQFGVSLSAHQKMEWTLEYDECMKRLP